MTKWPTAETIAPLVKKEVDRPIKLHLPNKWLWDIIESFIYHFRKFRTIPDVQNYIRNNPQIWNIHSVLNILVSLIEKSNINEQLRVYGEKGDPSEVAGEFGNVDFYKMLGFFSLIGLCRMHCLLGDYYKAKQELYHNVPTCHMMTGFFVGFSFLMTRCYKNAIKMFCSTLHYISSVQSEHAHKPEFVEICRRYHDRIISFLTICTIAYPMHIDQEIEQMIREKFSDNIARIQKGLVIFSYIKNSDVDELLGLYHLAYPMFISLNLDNSETAKSIDVQQTLVIIDELRHQCKLYNIRSLLKLYGNIPVNKLAHALNMKEDELQMFLISFKQNIVSGYGGEDEENDCIADMDFYIEDDVVYVADTKVDRKFSEYFIKQLEQLGSLNCTLDKMEAQIQETVVKQCESHEFNLLGKRTVYYKMLENASPTLFPIAPRLNLSASDSSNEREPFTVEEVFEHIRDLKDPEHPNSLEELGVLSKDNITVYDARYSPDKQLVENPGYSFVKVVFVPTISLCSMASVIGLSIKTKLHRVIPKRFKIFVEIKEGTHDTDEAINKQLADKERIAAAMENTALRRVIESCM